VHAPAIAFEKLADHRLRRDALVLRQERPPVVEAVLDPLVVADVLRIVGEVITDDVDGPPGLD
jgi:hypothetical protein